MMLFIIGVFILSTLTVKRTLRVSEEHLRESLGGSFEINVKYSKDNPYYHEEEVEENGAKDILIGLSVRKMYDEYGNEYYCVDETLRSRLEAKLIKTTLGFQLVR